MDASEDIAVNPKIAVGVASIGDLIAVRLSRRDFVGGAMTASAVAALGGCASAPPTRNAPFDFTFAEIMRGIDGDHHVPVGYTADVLIRWGDPLFGDSLNFNPFSQSPAAQRRQFGYNNDYIGYVALAPEAGQEARALLCVNHEYTSTKLMLPGVAAGYPESVTREHCEIEMAAHGGSIVEVVQENGRWAPVVGSPLNRRLMADATPMKVTGPAAGHARMRTNADLRGEVVAGTLNNCAGGITPWGTFLMAEENFNGNFRGALPANHPEAENHQRYGVPGGWYQWGRYFDRFDVSREPNEANRYGWIVEVDPLNPQSTPKKRTALGRFKHEGAENVIAPDGRLVIYMGDDQRFEYVYKFVTARAVDRNYPAANADLLDEGVLYVARFDADGSVEWLPLVHGVGPLTAENRFRSQADVVIEARRAADLVGATPMDRPEDVEPDGRTGRVYVMLTNNSRRLVEQVDAANPREKNLFGHIIEIIEPEGDFTATRSRWEFLVKCGDPADPSVASKWNAATSAHGWFASPDNCAIDPSGRLWVATDGNEASGANDGLWALATNGAQRGTGRAFFRAPIGAEVCGPCFAPDGRTLFLAVQHPGDGDLASFEQPSTRWPDFVEGAPPRPSVLAIRRIDGGVIGG